MTNSTPLTGENLGFIIPSNAKRIPIQIYEDRSIIRNTRSQYFSIIRLILSLKVTAAFDYGITLDLVYLKIQIIIYTDPF